jgi:hypothetical protein
VLTLDRSTAGNSGEVDVAAPANADTKLLGSADVKTKRGAIGNTAAELPYRPGWYESKVVNAAPRVDCDAPSALLTAHFSQSVMTVAAAGVPFSKVTEKAANAVLFSLEACIKESATPADCR